MQDRYLITTADERTWKFDRPVLFLGEWCCRHDRKHIWSNMDFQVAKPYGLRIWHKEIDLAYIQSLTSRLLKELANALNTYHETNYGLRYWHIILGNWLRNCVVIVYNRYCTLEQAMNNGSITGTTVFDHNNYNLASYDFESSYALMYEDPIWNNIIYGKILDFWNYNNIELLTCHDKLNTYYISSTQNNSKTKYRQLVQDIWNKVFKRNNEAFIIDSYLPKREELKLQLLLKQIPKIWPTIALDPVPYDSNKRKHFHLHINHHSGFEKFICKLLPELIPTCYLEGYKQLTKQVKSLKWPTKPKFILTGTHFFCHEIFKAWTASKINLGVPYYISQHGNDQGFIGCPETQETVYVDKYFTWGSGKKEKDSPKHVPTFNFKLVGVKHAYSRTNDHLLLILRNNPQLRGLDDLSYKYKTYQDMLYKFVEMLPDYIQAKLIVRLFFTEPHLKYTWHERFPNILVDPGEADINKLKTASRLVIHAYDSTGIPESLGLNTPMLCLWPGKVSHILPLARPYYSKLKEAGILSDNPEHAAEFVSLHWDNILEWWESSKTQEARGYFCDNYGRPPPKRPLRCFKSLLLQNVDKK